MLEFVLEKDGANVRLDKRTVLEKDKMGNRFETRTWRYGNGKDARKVYEILKSASEGSLSENTWLDYRHYIIPVENSNILIMANVIEGWTTLFSTFDIALTVSEETEEYSTTYHLKDGVFLKIVKTLRSLGVDSNSDISDFLTQIDEEWEYCLSQGKSKITVKYQLDNAQVMFDLTESDFEKENEK